MPASRRTQVGRVGRITPASSNYMPSSFEATQARWMNKRTDTHLMSRTSSPEPRMPSPPPRPIPGTPGRRASVGLSQPFTWYRADWGTGGNKFPVHLSPRDTGGPWEGHGRPGVSAFKSPVDAFAGLDQQPEKEYQRFILNRSIAHGSWTPRQTPEEWSSTLLAKGTVVLSGDKSSKPFSTVEKLEFAWEPTKHVRKSFKPIPKEELSPCAHTPHLPATAPPPPPPIQRLSTRLCLSVWCWCFMRRIHGLPKHKIAKVEHVWRTTTADASRMGILLPLL